VAMGWQCLRLLATIRMPTIKYGMDVQVSQNRTVRIRLAFKLPCVTPSREPMKYRSFAVFQQPIGDARTYLMWPKVLFEFKFGQFEGKVPNESSVRGLGRERDFFTRRISTGVIAVYCVAKEDIA